MTVVDLAQLAFGDSVEVCFHPRMEHAVRAVRVRAGVARWRTGRRWRLRPVRVQRHAVVTRCPDCPATSWFLLDPAATGYQVELAPYVIAARKGARL